jgi:hypothetical protein
LIIAPPCLLLALPSLLLCELLSFFGHRSSPHGQ